MCRAVREQCPTSYHTQVPTTKTTVYLPAEDKRRLTALAAETGVSEAELLREGVRLVLDRRRRPAPRLATAASSDGGSAADADLDLARLGFASPPW